MVVMRYLSSHIKTDLNKKMVFLTGPRQCGKTTLAQDLLAETSQGIYLNWDDPDHRVTILKRQWSDHHGLLVLGEVHKMRKWKNWLKGTYDTQKQRHRFLVTGSSRLDLYRKAGDSLLGRYHLWRLHPFSLSELPQGVSLGEGFRRLMTVGGFPEPFLANDEREARRWRRERMEKLLRQDVREIEEVRDLNSMQLLVDLLRTRVGTPVVISNLARDIQVSPMTVKRWIEILEAMYIVFQVKPYTQKIARAIQKPPKIYFYDNMDVEATGSEGSEGPRLENLVATHLLKSIHFAQDYLGYNFELCYVRDKEHREVDFVVLKERKPIELIEVKTKDTSISKNLEYFAKKIAVKKATQLVNVEKYRFQRGPIQVKDLVQELSDIKRFW